MAKTEITYETVVRNIKNKDIAPVYYLMGEEPYYIDKIADFIVDTILSEEEKDFNLSVFYGAETTMSDVLMTAKRYPMMSEYAVVVVKEAQQLENLELLADYLNAPQPQSILVFCHKNGALDRRKAVANAIEKAGVLFESRKLKEVQLRTFIAGCVSRKKLTIDEKSVEMLVDFVGSDLSRLSAEVDKLALTLPEGQNRILPEQIERNIGISKEFNNFELKNALLVRDVVKVNRILNYFDKNAKTNPIQMTLASLFSFYSNLMLAHYAPEKTEKGIAEYLGFRQTWQARELDQGVNMYSARKTMNIISAIRLADAKSKGVDSKSTTNGELLTDLLFFILH